MFNGQGFLARVGRRVDADSGATTLRYRDGGVYRGDVRGDDRHGRGRMLYADGSWFDGGWCEDKKHGEGIFCDAGQSDGAGGGGGGAFGNGTDGGGDGGMGALTAPARQVWSHGELEAKRWSAQMRTASSDGIITEPVRGEPGVGVNDEEGAEAAQDFGLATFE